MDYRACIFCLIIFMETPMVFSCLTEEQSEACDAVFSSDAMKWSCCSPMQEFVDITRDCQKQTKSRRFTCAVSECVTAKYGILTKGQIDENKVRALIKNLNANQPESTNLNSQVLKNCLKMKYRQYSTVDPKCDVMKFHSCAFIGYMFGCQQFIQRSRYCKKLSSNVATCKPVFKQYLKKITPCQ
ncbi:uncharacterized protein LOC113493172 [Trichoplusia ni]|uniref:Uncharacterized protein LOC113493172 n=1 Tax=Trichoplusia ni TaxID=7111 RepID=A0A7E5VEY6_TRINI|nr:uncharacterized protein LOC113493172 [Trichoplusia ni]